jgi:ribose transport system substrate-binding protein
MARRPTRHPAGATVVALGVAVAMALTSCSKSSDDTANAGGSGPAEVAFLNASVANTWLQSSFAAMKTVAAKNNITITEFDAQFQPPAQTKQLQDVVASGKYKGIVVAAIDGNGLIPDLEAAIAKGIKVVVLNQVVGPSLDTADPQVTGVSASILAPPVASGTRVGALTVRACAGLSPCRVVYFYGIKGIPLDNALKQGFDAMTKESPAITVVATAEGKYLGPDVGLKAMQDVLQRTKDFDVVVGSDQSIQGVQLALEDAGKLGKVKLIGFGGSKPALDAVESGAWFGDVFGSPAGEGTLAMQAMVDALRSDKVTGGVDPGTRLPNNALVTKDNVDQFTAEWNG